MNLFEWLWTDTSLLFFFIHDIAFCSEAVLLFSPLTHILQINEKVLFNQYNCSTVALLFMLLFWFSEVKQFQTFNMVKMFVCLRDILWTFIYALKFYIKGVLSECHSMNGKGYYISFSENDCLTTEKGSTVQIIFDYLHAHAHAHTLIRIRDVIIIVVVIVVVIVVIVNSFHPKPLAKKLDNNKFNWNEVHNKIGNSNTKA